VGSVAATQEEAISLAQKSRARGKRTIEEEAAQGNRLVRARLLDARGVGYSAILPFIA
jgi:hypothetical protein